MKVLLVRHADAVDATATLTDEHRYLSITGRSRIRAVGRALRTKGIEWETIRTSPLVRAMQTAERLADALDYVGVVAATRALAPGGAPRVAAQELFTAGDAVILVGHEPDLSSVGAFLTGQPAFPSFRKAEAMLVENGQPVWRLHPESLEFDRLIIA